MAPKRPATLKTAPALRLPHEIGGTQNEDQRTNERTRGEGRRRPSRLYGQKGLRHEDCRTQDAASELGVSSTPAVGASGAPGQGRVGRGVKKMP